MSGEDDGCGIDPLCILRDGHTSPCKINDEVMEPSPRRHAGLRSGALPPAPDRIARLEAALREVLPFFEEACEYIAENPTEDDRLTAYLRRIETARAALSETPASEGLGELVRSARASVKAAIGVAKSARPADPWVIGMLDLIQGRFDRITEAIADRAGGEGGTA